MSEKDLNIVKEAHKRFAIAVDSESVGRFERLDDIKFVRLGQQWPEAVKRDRERPGAERPMLTINRIFQFRNQVINEIRQNRPSIKCRPVDDNADIETAEVLQGLIRHIQEISRADIAYDTAAEWQVDTGLGYFRIQTDYCDNGSFDQDIVIKRVPDPTKVYFDPSSTEPDGSDAKWAFIIEEFTKDEFKAAYPGEEEESWSGAGTGDSAAWISQESIRVAEYFVIDQKPRTLARLVDGSTIWKDQIPKEHIESIADERQSYDPICKWYKIAGDKIIESTELPTSFIPVIPVYGSEVWVEGVRHLHGLTRYAKDAARLYNYMQSANTELLALAPRAPYIVAVGQIDGYETEWQNANQVNLSVLTYKPTTTDGTQAPPPRREMPPGVNPGLEAAMNRSIDDMKACMGIFDASLGNRESDQSGKAILSQQRQASIGNFHFSDNLSRSIKHAGKIIVEMIPKIYDTARVARIIGEDGEPESVQINPEQQSSKTEQKTDSGEIKYIYNLGVGKYDVVVDTGPSYATKRQEAAESMLAFVQTDPAILQIAGDLIVKNMDWPGADEIAKRMKVMLPPQIAAADKEAGQGAPVDPQIEQQMHQMADQMQHMSQALQEAQSDKQEKELQFKIDIYNAETNRIKADGELEIKKAGILHGMVAADLAHQLSATQTLSEESQELEQTEEPAQPSAPQPTTAEAAQ
jgi:hypothetical protein